jgi:hypothetical protein
MKQRTVILVDGENISYKKADEITALSRRLGNVVERKVYHRQKDPITRMWNKKTAYKNIHIPGEAEHNKIDHRIQKDARKYMQSPDIDVICVVSSDSDFCCLREDAAAAGKQLYFIGEKKTPRKLRKAGARFIELR